MGKRKIFLILFLLFVSQFGRASEPAPLLIRELHGYLAKAMALFDIDDNVFNTFGVIKIMRYEYDPHAPIQLYQYHVPGHKLVIPIHYRLPLHGNPILVDGPVNARIRKLQTDDVAWEDWPEELRPYFHTQLLPMFELPGISPSILGSRLMESSVDGQPNQFRLQLEDNYKKGILLRAPMLEIMRRFLASPVLAQQVGYVTSRRHSVPHLYEGFQYLHSLGVFDFMPRAEYMRAVGNPEKNPTAHDPNVKLALLKKAEFSGFLEKAAREKMGLFFSDDDPSNFHECLAEFLRRRAAGEFAEVPLIIVYTGHSKLSSLPEPVVVVRPFQDEPAYYPIETLQLAADLLPEPMRPLAEILTPGNCGPKVFEAGVTH